MPEYKPTLEINKIYSKLSPNNCAVRLFAGDGKPVGPCAHFIKDGVCPTHGRVFSDYQYEKQEEIVRGHWLKDWVYRHVNYEKRNKGKTS